MERQGTELMRWLLNEGADINAADNVPAYPYPYPTFICLPALPALLALLACYLSCLLLTSPTPHLPLLLPLLLLLLLFLPLITTTYDCHYCCHY